MWTIDETTKRLKAAGLADTTTCGGKQQCLLDAAKRLQVKWMVTISASKVGRDRAWALAAFVVDSGAQLAREDLVLQWEEVTGAETARHANPVALEGGILTVQCDSTAWAKNLQLMRAEIVTQLMRRFPDANVQNVRFVGPDVPSWKWGPRAVPGRGPRDTYG